MSDSARSLHEVARVATGEIPADLAVLNAQVVNVYTAELLPRQNVLVKHGRIAYAGPNGASAVASSTTVIDAQGQTLIPGLIDGHTHMDYIASTPEIVKYALKSGATSIISETAQLSCALGAQGVLEYLKSTRRQPVKFWITLPPQHSISPIFRRHAITLAEIKKLLRRREVVGLGELYWAPLLAGERPQLEFVQATLRAGKTVEGHSAGASGNKLQGYAGLGVTSDHEPIAAEDTLERLRLGFSVMVREGEVRRDLEQVSQIRTEKLDFRRLSVSTDGIGPIQFTSEGFMDALVRKSIRLGFPPVQAIQMATLNVAEHFRLDHLIGGIAPGRAADLVLIPDLSEIQPHTVISDGKIVVRNGQLTAAPRSHSYPRETRATLHLDHEFSGTDFAVPYAGQASTARVRVIDQVTNLLTREAILDLPTSGGMIGMDAKRDVIKVAAVERLHAPGRCFSAFIRGTGLKKGAAATSTCWDASDITLVGANEDDMALAVNRIHELGGGLVLCLDGQVLAEQAFPVGGMISEEPMEKLSANLSDIQAKAHSLGFTSPDIRTTLSVLTTGAIPYLRICESGLFNLRSNSPVDLVIE